MKAIEWPSLPSPAPLRRTSKEPRREREKFAHWPGPIVYSTLLPIRALNCANNTPSSAGAQSSKYHPIPIVVDGNSFAILYCSRWSRYRSRSRSRSRWQSPNGVYWDIINLTLVHFRSDFTAMPRNNFTERIYCQVFSDACILAKQKLPIKWPILSRGKKRKRRKHNCANTHNGKCQGKQNPWNTQPIGFDLASISSQRLLL